MVEKRANARIALAILRQGEVIIGIVWWAPVYSCHSHRQDVASGEAEQTFVPCFQFPVSRMALSFRKRTGSCQGNHFVGYRRQRRGQSFG